MFEGIITKKKTFPGFMKQETKRNTLEKTIFGGKH